MCTEWYIQCVLHMRFISKIVLKCYFHLENSEQFLLRFVLKKIDFNKKHVERITLLNDFEYKNIRVFERFN